MKRIKVSDVITAAEKNGYPWGTGIPVVKDQHESYCVLAQAALNIGEISWDMLSDALDRLKGGLGRDIWAYNDCAAKDYGDALSFLKTCLEPYKNKNLKVSDG